eukprot:TRINITY_DN200_c0_g1_i2.p1 TRINITY_DN200_c0_g1~~TRINITY_DN200_c0_g1_i2.p1  ORF type:complete len:114 (-),score=15.85 TRINITY_DN200_c0_g1_i2:145-486(-)
MQWLTRNVRENRRFTHPPIFNQMTNSLEEVAMMLVSATGSEEEEGGKGEAEYKSQTRFSPTMITTQERRWDGVHHSSVRGGGGACWSVPPVRRRKREEREKQSTNRRQGSHPR